MISQVYFQKDVDISAECVEHLPGDVGCLLERGHMMNEVNMHFVRKLFR